MYKYGIPPGMSKEEIEELHAHIDEMKAKFNEWLADPVEQEKCRRFARIAGTIRPCDLDRQFTI